MYQSKNTVIHKTVRKAACFLLALGTILMMSFLWMERADAATKTIRVGYIDYDGFIEEVNEYYRGYGVEYLQRIAEHTSWKYEYVYDTWENCLQKLENGEIDLLCTAQYTPERGERFLYSAIPLGYEYTMIYAREDSEVYYQDIEAMEDSRIGLLQDSFQTDNFFLFAEENQMNFTPVYYETESQLMWALQNGSVDLVAVGSLAYHSHVRVVGQYGAEPFYCITGKENTEIMGEIDEALREIKIEEPGLETELMQEYYGTRKLSSSPLFTREEHEYIQQAEPITVRLMENANPLSYRKDDQLAGIFVDYLELISTKSGIEFEIELEGTTGTLDEQMRSMVGEDYLMVRSKRGLEYSGLDQLLLTTKPMLETQLSYVRRQEDGYIKGSADQRVFALTREMQYLGSMLKADSDHFEITYYDSAKECLQAVLNYEADIAILDSFVSTYLMQKPKYSEELMEASGNEMKNGVCIVAAEGNEILIDILNKTINYISSEEEDIIVTTEILRNPYRQDMNDIIYEYRYMIFGVGVCIVLAIIIYTILLQRMTNLKIEKREYEILQQRVQQDELTGVYNRKSFYEKAQEMIDRTTEKMYIIIMDISNFKVVNDLYGMESGDRLLKQIAQELLNLGTGEEMIVARFTGDHFYMCMGQAVFQNINFPKRFKTFLTDMEITVTYGVFVVDEQRDLPVNIMCDRASLAAHNEELKQLQYICYYTEEERKRILDEQEIQNDMEKALQNRQFCIFVQPKYDIFTERIIGGEALVRWIHPEKGTIPPAKFIGVFEKNGFIIRLDYYVWEETCKLLSRFKQQGIPLVPISINVSRAHFYGKELLDKLLELVEKYQIDPRYLELEITETICAEDSGVIHEKIRELQHVGFKVAMDDFGSGYSSLNMLKEMPLDILKMDLKFLDGGEDIEKSHNIMRTLISLAHSLDLTVVVEGVETGDQVEFLKEVGNHYVQGYYYSRPVDCETYEAMQSSKED